MVQKVSHQVWLLSLLLTVLWSPSAKSAVPCPSCYSPSKAWPNLAVRWVTDPSKPLQLVPGFRYLLSHGIFTLNATVQLFSGQQLSLGSTYSATKPTVILPPRTTGTNASRLHFAMFGGQLELHNVTMSGYKATNASAQSPYVGPYVGGGGIVLNPPQTAGSEQELNDGSTPESSTLVAAKVKFEYITPRAVANVHDVKASMTFVDTTFQFNRFDAVRCFPEQDGIGDTDWQCYAELPVEQYGCAGVTTVSNVTFEGYTKFINNTWGALKSFPTPWESGDFPNITFKGPVRFEQNNKNWAAMKADWWPGEIWIDDKNAAGILAANSNVVFKSTAIFKDNRQGALLISGSARFEGYTVFDGNQDNSVAAVEFLNASVVFARDITCKASGGQRGGYRTCGSGGCMRVTRSTINFEQTTVFTNNTQDATGMMRAYHCAPSGGALSCQLSNITFQGKALFNHNSAVNSQHLIGDRVAWQQKLDWGPNRGGGAWYLDSCTVVAKQIIRFVNNTSGTDIDYLSPEGGAVFAGSSSMLFEKGLVLSDNSAGGDGGAMLLTAATLLQIKGSRMVCNNNYAGRTGSCMSVLDLSVVLWNSSSSCVQGNVVNHRSAAEGMLSPDSQWGSRAWTLGAAGCVHIVDSRVDFTGAVNFGSNMFYAKASNDSTEMDLVVASFDPAMPSKFTCSGLQPRGVGNYSVQGNICSHECTGNNCTCFPPRQWSDDKCSCKLLMP